MVFQEQSYKENLDRSLESFGEKLDLVINIEVEDKNIIREMSEELVLNVELHII